VDIGVKPLAHAEPGVVDVAVDVVGEEDRCDREGGDEEEDRSPDEPPPESRRQSDGPQVGGEADPDQGEGETGVDRRYLPALSPPPT
jgi:hypothetical protein